MEFLWHRILRVYPVIVVAVALRLASRIMMGQRALDMHKVKIFLANISLFGNIFIFGENNIEPIIWSLAIEVKFYILMAILFAISRSPMLRLSVVPMLFGVAVALGVAGRFAPPFSSPMTIDWALAISSLPVLFIGTAASLYYRKIISLNKFLGMSVLAGAQFCADDR
jgi:peptidoglycan/LPS O-acetylase OafA/YrhL